MHRKLVLFFALPLFTGPALFAQAADLLREKTHFFLKDDVTHVHFCVKSRAQSTVNVQTTWLDSEDAPIETRKADFPVPPGEACFDVPAPLPRVWKRSMQSAFRLLYVLTRDGGIFTQGILAFPSLADYAFDTWTISNYRIQSGKPLVIRARTLHPYTRKPVAKVRVTAMIEADDESRKVTLPPVESGPDGYAIIETTVPPDFGDDPSASLTFRKGDLEVETILDSRASDSARTALSFDKPLHQPGQTVHLRIFAVGENRRPLRDADVKFQISDSEGTLLFQAATKTTRFGIAAASWPVPKTAKEGPYRLNVDVEDGQDLREQINIRKYELPTFRAVAKTDRTFYLKGQDAAVNITAEYLFGKPVVGAVVRVDNSDTNQQPKFEVRGIAGLDGRFRLRVSTAPLHAQLAANRDLRFTDGYYTVSITDPTTRRTESTGFAVRATTQGLHLNWVNGRHDGTGYVSATLADGAPVECQVTIAEEEGATQTVATNRYGLARVRFKDPDTTRIRMSAKTEPGLTGDLEAHPYGPGAALKVSTNRSLYRRGEPVRVRLESDSDDSTGLVEIARNGLVLATAKVELRNGKGEVEIPFHPLFHRELTVTAFVADEGNRSLVDGGTVILFTGAGSLEASIGFDKPEYRPGEAARATLLAKRGGMPVEAAFGVSIADEAVYQRAETDGAGQHSYSGDRYSQATHEVSGVTRSDLYNWDSKAVIDEQLDLVGELMLRQDPVEDPESETFDTRSVIHDEFLKRGHRGRIAAAMMHLPPNEFPSSAAAMQALLEKSIPDYRRFRDPWGNRYRFAYQPYANTESVRVLSIGPDQLPETSDDYEFFAKSQPFFSRWRAAVEKELKSTEDLPTSQSIEGLVERARIDPATFRDPWGQPIWWTWATIGDHRHIAFWSDGPPERRAHPPKPIQLESFNVHYFARQAERIRRLLLESEITPATPRAFVSTLKDLGFDLAALRDPWGNPYRVDLVASNEYRNKQVPVTAADRARGVVGQTRLVPVTVLVERFLIRSEGAARDLPDDDITVGTFPRVEIEQRGDRTEQSMPVRRNVRPSMRVGFGMIEGVITDSTGAVVPGAILVAIDDSGKEFPALTDSNGYYVLNLPARRIYKLRATASGFRAAIRSSLSVLSRTSLIVDIRLDVGSVMEAVEVRADSVRLMSMAAGVVSFQRTFQTPRLRQYFVETLVWEPSIETNPRGEAELRFRIADNITRWKTVLIGSTLDGETFESTASIRSFQPFFADLNPPAVLTQNDRIELAVPVRNYTDSTQSVEARIDPQPWMKVLGKPVRAMEVGSDAASVALFNLEAANAAADAAQQITVAGADVSDAIRKPLSIHPDGREAAVSDSAVMQGSGKLSVEIPDNALDGSLTGEIKIYPNLAAHVLEALDGLAKRPAGCAEQITSALSANVLVARILAKDNIAPALAATVNQNIRDGLVTLKSLQQESGEFGYADGKVDARLTVYILQCLRDIHELADQQEWDTAATQAGAMIDKARRALIASQLPNGSWKDPWYDHWPSGPPSVELTAATAKALAGIDNDANEAAIRAINYVESVQLIADDPLITSMLALAARLAGDERSTKWTNRVSKLAKVENGAHYWALEHNGFFGSWGDPGRAESTGAAVEALAAEGATHAELVNSAICFLLRKKDRYGVWFATSPTIAVMRGLVAAMEAIPASGDSGNKALELIVNGQSAGSVPLAGGAKPAPLESRSISKLLKPGINEIELRGSGSMFSAQAVVNYYVPWKPVTELRPQGAQSRLLLDVKMSRTSGTPEDWIYCNAVARRIGYRGGMIVAEIGLPPGAEVDRASLRNDFPAPYEVKPDRIVFYLWPRAAGNSIQFRFKPRMRMRAKSASFQLWDYYNPDLKTELQPVRFEIR